MNSVRNSKTSNNMLNPAFCRIRNSMAAEHSTKREVSNGMNRRDFFKAAGLGAASLAMPASLLAAQ